MLFSVQIQVRLAEQTWTFFQKDSFKKVLNICFILQRSQVKINSQTSLRGFFHSVEACVHKPEYPSAFFFFQNMKFFQNFTACLYAFTYISYTYGLSFNSLLRHYTRMPKLILIVQQTQGIQGGCPEIQRFLNKIHMYFKPFNRHVLCHTPFTNIKIRLISTSCMRFCCWSQILGSASRPRACNQLHLC